MHPSSFIFPSSSDKPLKAVVRNVVPPGFRDFQIASIAFDRNLEIEKMVERNLKRDLEIAKPGLERNAIWKSRDPAWSKTRLEAKRDLEIAKPGFGAKRDLEIAKLGFGAKRDLEIAKPG